MFYSASWIQNLSRKCQSSGRPLQLKCQSSDQMETSVQMPAVSSGQYWHYGDSQSRSAFDWHFLNFSDISLSLLIKMSNSNFEIMVISFQNLSCDKLTMVMFFFTGVLDPVFRQLRKMNVQFPFPFIYLFYIN